MDRGYADKLKDLGYTHVVSLRPSQPRKPVCKFSNGSDYTYVVWQGFVFIKYEPDIERFVQSINDDVVLMEVRNNFCEASTGKQIGGVQYCATELNGTELSQWIDFFGTTVENSLSMDHTPIWFYSEGGMLVNSRTA